MTIDERIEDLMLRCPEWAIAKGNQHRNRNFLCNALLEVARDQRHACAEAVNAVETTITHNTIFKHVAHQAVMNAKLEAKQMNTHEFKSISAVQNHLCGVIINGDYCAYPASADCHMPESAQQEVDRLSDELVANHKRLSARTKDKATARPWRITPYDSDEIEVADQRDSHIAFLNKSRIGKANAALIVTAVNSYDASQKRIAELEAREESAKCLLLRYDALAAPFAVLGESKVAALENYLTANRAKIAELEAALQKITDGNNECCGMCTARLALKEKE